MFTASSFPLTTLQSARHHFICTPHSLEAAAVISFWHHMLSRRAPSAASRVVNFSQGMQVNSFPSDGFTRCVLKSVKQQHEPDRLEVEYS